jgi:hypothetical protein
MSAGCNKVVKKEGGVVKKEWSVEKLQVNK